MIHVKTFVPNSCNTLHHDRLDNAINHFLTENDVELVDIKYSTAAAGDSNGKISWIPSAMLIYKDKSDEK